MSAKPKLGRPEVYKGSSLVLLRPSTSAPRLQRDSQRREIIDFLLARDGVATLDAAAKQFGRARVLALVRAKWLQIEESAA